MTYPQFLLIQIPKNPKKEVLLNFEDFPTIDIEAVIAHALYCFYENSDYKGFHTGAVQDFVSSEVMESLFDDLMTDEQAKSYSDDPRMSPTGSLLTQLLDEYIHELIDAVHREFQSLNMIDYENFRYVYKRFLQGPSDTIVFQYEY